MNQRIKNTNTCSILIVDDEEKSTKYFKKIFSGEFDVIIANRVHEADIILEEQGSRISVALIDQRMPEQKGNVLLARMRREFPAITRLVTTAYSDIEDTIEAVNNGHIYKYITKPWDIDELRDVLHEASERNIEYINRENLLREKRKIMYQLAGTIAHELKTPLSAVYSAATGPLEHVPELVSVYRKNCGQPPAGNTIPDKHLAALESVTADIREEARHALTMIDMLMLNISDVKSASGNDYCSMQQTIQRAIERYPFTGNQRRLVKFDAARDFQYCCRQELMVHVFYNLIKNSLYSLDCKNCGGTISIDIDSDQESNRVLFRDTGTGIASRDLPTIFDSFFSTKNRSGDFSVGIGLTFCRNVLESMDAEICCNSEAGEYTEFILSFPRPRDTGNIIKFGKTAGN